MESITRKHIRIYSEIVKLKRFYKYAENMTILTMTENTNTFPFDEMHINTIFSKIQEMSLKICA